MPNESQSFWDQKYDYHFDKSFEGVTRNQELVDVVDSIVYYISTIFPLKEARILCAQKGVEHGFEEIMVIHAMPVIVERLKEAGIPTNFKDGETQFYLKSIEEKLRSHYLHGVVSGV